ncbi:MAG: hypothetical protein MJ093_07545 [Saccharofermentans sp.]|nr:hypothetical protein [Saccharofermentans sp.]
MKRIISLLVILSLLITGCTTATKKAEPREMEYIEDGEWFNTITYRTEPHDGFNGLWGDGMNEGVYYASPDELVIRESYRNTITEEFYNCINKYKLYDNGNCEIVSSIDMAQFENTSEDGMDSSSLQDILVVANDIYVVVNHNFLDGEEISNEFYIQKLNLDSGELGERILTEDLRTLYLTDFGRIYSAWYLDNQVVMVANKSNGNTYVITLNEDFEIVEENQLRGVNNVVDAYSSDSMVYLLEYDYMSRQSRMYEFNKSTNAVESMDDLSNDYFKYVWDYCGDLALAVDNYGVNTYDYENNSVNRLIDFNNCNLLMDRQALCSVAYSDGDTTILYAPARSTDENSAGYNFYRLTRAESNPNAGKAILRLASVDGVYDETVTQAIYEFNESNDNAFIIIDDRYDIENYRDFDYSMDSGYLYDPWLRDNEADTTAHMNANNQLRIDIMAGTGPDILLNSYAIGDINNSDCMLDLREYLLGDDSINSDEYISVIFGGNDAIYQLPLSVSPVCFYWLENNDIEATGTYGGMTYEQYEELVSVNCNGEDPLSYYRNQIDYFVEMFNYNYDEFVHDGQIDINNDEFRAMAEFVNTRNKEMTYNMFSNWEMYPIGRYYDREILNPDLNHYYAFGMPSINGDRGIKLKCDMSIGVATSCPLIDDAVAFVKTIMSTNASNIRIEDIRTSTENMMESTNSSITLEMEYSMDITEYDLITDDYIDKYVEMLQNAESLYEYDASIAMIMYEELQAYFAGDKTLDEVIPIIENRCQTVLDEKQ